MATTRNERSERILRAAMHLFHERGFDGVGVDLIGERAGMSGPAIYRYFSGKDEILITLVDEAIDRVLMSTGGDFDNPREELEHLIRGHVQRALEERELMSVWTRERNSIPKPYRSRLRSRINRYIDRWVDCLDACYPGNNRELLVSAVHATHGLIDSTAFWPAQSLKLPALDDVLTGMALASLEYLAQSGPSDATGKLAPRVNAN
ncbi:TetR/AcrR family transcriptional regulator [Mycobacterium sp. CVI_P3]|uniref:TetR/AcrR family transcriptional regulator n=1 Tax=Mycobacterium pinniadriaticum TaxID=2994102 RepID=A0ABT3SAV1_9MYCO|nr:TetR/AcrR family transcriptional regulator [Mycobacterium pinniadriaticum]MCX2930072.1 TetR/AcrR family transcriptional regulator [Mycobacterium pinniadriaticum]MCX2936279.1 TetR/AcrR family transcriptional regulator [Mycobacterium pinniadriaticum]